MSVNVDVKKLRENPELFKVMLKAVCDKIESGISQENDFVDGHKQLILFKECICSSVDNMYETYEISKKLTELQKLEKEHPEDYVARRATGDFQKLNFRGKELFEKKMYLQSKIKKSTETLVNLNEKLEGKDAIFKQQNENFIEAKRILQDTLNTYSTT